MGSALARQAAALLGPGGSITLLTRDTTSFPQPAFEIARAAFEREIQKSGAVLQPVRALEEDPLRPPQVPPGDFFELIRRVHPGDVIVSFLGPPLLLEEQRSELGPVKPKVVAFCPGDLPRQIDLRLLASHGLLHAAVLSRPLKDIRPGASTFDELYVVADSSRWTQPVPGTP